jgi:uncharacterized RDD family membrane protein YckC
MRYLHRSPASNFKRILAYLIDTMPIQMGLYLVSMIFFGVSPIVDVETPAPIREASQKANMLIGVGTLLIWIVYCVIGELSPLRGTLGKKMMGISVQSARGGHPRVGQVIGRNFGKILSAIPCYLGFLAAFLSNGKRAWHDTMSGTSVVERR